MRRVMWLAVVATTLGCGSGESAEEKAPEPMARAADFVLLGEAEDPLAAHRPQEVTCSELTGWGVEDDVLEVDTTRCNYLAVGAPARIDVAAGRTLTTQVAYFELTAPEPAMAHVALLVNGRTLWEREVAVPGPADVISVTAELAEDVAAGAPVVWHLHNHGRNNWRLADVFVEP